MTRLVVVRHGRTRANATRQLLGRRDVPLDRLGEIQAVALAAAAGPVDRVVASPLTRTRQTAAAFGLPVSVDDRLVELDYGDYDGMALADVPPEFWDQLRSGGGAERSRSGDETQMPEAPAGRLADSWGGGAERSRSGDETQMAEAPAGRLADQRAKQVESLAGLRTRVEAALVELSDPSRDETIAVVTHVSPIKAAVTWALGVGDDVTWHLFVGPASISRIDVSERGPILHSFNEVAHLSELIDPEADAAP